MKPGRVHPPYPSEPSASRTPSRSCHEIRPLFLPREGESRDLPGPPPFPRLGASTGSLPDSPQRSFVSLGHEPRYSHAENPTLSKFSRSSSNSALGGSCPAFVPSGIGAAERRCHRVLGKRDARMGPMSGQGLWAGGTPGGLHRKRFPLGRDVLLAPEPAPPRVSAGSLSRGSIHGFPSRASPSSELAA